MRGCGIPCRCSKSAVHGQSDEFWWGMAGLLPDYHEDLAHHLALAPGAGVRLLCAGDGRWFTWGRGEARHSQCALRQG